MKFVSRLTAAASVAAALALSAPAGAQTATYSTLGQFTGGCNSGAASLIAVCTIGTSSITFTGVTGNAVVGPFPSNLSFGDFQTASDITNHAYAGITFTMFVSQTTPSASAVSQAVSGGLNGNLSSNNSTINFIGAPAVFNLGTGQTATYTVFPTQIAPLSTSGGNTTVNGTVVVNPPTTTTPEPSTYALMAAGMAAMGLVARRRRVA